MLDFGSMGTVFALPWCAVIYHAVLTVFIATAFAFGLFYIIRLNPWKSETKAFMKCNALQFFGKPALATDIVMTE